MMADKSREENAYKEFLSGMAGRRKDLMTDIGAVNEQIKLFDRWIRDAFNRFYGKEYFFKMSGGFICSRNHLARHLRENFGIDAPEKTLEDFWRELSQTRRR